MNSLFFDNDSEDEEFMKMADQQEQIYFSQPQIDLESRGKISILTR